MLFVDESSVYPSAALDTVRCAIDAPVILAASLRIGRTAGSLELLFGLASRGVKVHGLTILGGALASTNSTVMGP